MGCGISHFKQFFRFIVPVQSSSHELMSLCFRSDGDFPLYKALGIYE